MKRILGLLLSLTLCMKCQNREYTCNLRFFYVSYKKETILNRSNLPNLSVSC